MRYPSTSLIAQIKKERKRKGITQTELATMLGLPQPSIARIETGVVSPTLVMIAELTRKTAYNGKRRTDVKEVIYFKARIKIRELMYCVQLNIFDSRISGYQLYDINKISQVGGPRSESEVHSGIDSILGKG